MAVQSDGEAAPVASASGLDLIVKKTDGPEHTVILRGELDDYTAPALRRCVSELVDSGARRVVFDLRELEFVDSTGIGVMVGALKRFRSVGGDLALESPGKTIFKVLELTGLTRVFTVRNPQRPADTVLATACELAERSDDDDALERLLASCRDRALLNQARARCLASLDGRRPDPRRVRALDLLDRALEEVEHRPAPQVQQV